MTFRTSMFIGLLVTAVSTSGLQAEAPEEHGWCKRLQSRLWERAQHFRLHFKQNFRAGTNKTFYHECPPYWMDNYGYYSTCWREFPETCYSCPSVPTTAPESDRPPSEPSAPQPSPTAPRPSMPITPAPKNPPPPNTPQTIPDAEDESNQQGARPRSLQIPIRPTSDSFDVEPNVSRPERSTTDGR